MSTSQSNKRKGPKFRRNQKVTDGYRIYRLLREATKGWWIYYGGGGYIVHQSSLRPLTRRERGTHGR